MSTSNSDMKTVRARRDSIRALGAALVVLLFFSLAVSRAVDWLPGAHDPPFAHRLGQLAARDKKPYRLLLGSSRLGSAVRASALPGPLETYNAARPNGGPFIGYLDLQRIVERHGAPAEVVVELWWISVVAPLLELRWKTALSRPERSLYCDFGGETDSWAPARWDRLWSFASDCTKLRSYLLPDWASRVDKTRQIPEADGWLDPGSEADSRQPRLLRESLRVHGPLLRRFAAHPAQDRSLRETVALCRQHGARPTFFLTPNSPGYLRAVAPEFRRDFLTYCRRLAVEEKVPLAGALEWGREDDFVDGSHLVRGRTLEFTGDFLRQLRAASIPD